MNKYRVKVEAFVVVEASNLKDAKAKGEVAVRSCIEHGYLIPQTEFAEGWERFAFQAVGKPERMENE